MLESDSELIAAIQAVSKSVNKVVTTGKAVTKVLDKFDSTKVLEKQNVLSDAVDILKGTDLTPFACGSYQKDILVAIEKKLHDLRLNAHHDLVTGLMKGVDKQEQFRILSDIPLVIYLHPLTLEVQFEQMKASWMYAHELLQTVTLDPVEILETHKSILELFRASRIDSHSFWKVLKMAYDMVLIKTNTASGGRVDIVELLTPLAWLWPNQVAVKKGGVFPRYLLAYQLQKLRNDGLLQNNGLRIELGTATGGSTRNKANVLYIPAGMSEGQYYLSICIR